MTTGRLLVVAVSIAFYGCAAVPLPETPNHEQSTPPKAQILKEIFLSLPNNMVADMPLSGRKTFLKHESEDNDARNKRFDPENGLIRYFTDSNEKTGATSMFYLKVLPTFDGSYIVFIHIPKPFANIQAPSDSDTYILRPSNLGWLDATAELLPKDIKRDWYFLPQRKTSIIQAGPNIGAIRHDGRGIYWNHVRAFDLLWDGLRFKVIKLEQSEENILTEWNDS